MDPIAGMKKSLYNYKLVWVGLKIHTKGEESDEKSIVY
jgi:hypothetical protein